MTSADRDKHDHFLRLYVENEEALRGFVLAGADAGGCDAVAEV